MGSSWRQSIQRANVGTDAGKLTGGLGLDGQEETEQLLIGGRKSWREALCPGRGRLTSVFILFSEQILTNPVAYEQDIASYKMFEIFHLNQIVFFSFLYSENVLNSWVIPLMDPVTDASAFGRAATAAADTIKKTNPFFESK